MSVLDRQTATLTRRELQIILSFNTATEDGGRHKPLAVRSKLKVINRRIYEARVAGNTCRIVKALNKVDAPI